MDGFREARIHPELQPTGGQPTGEAVEQAARESGQLPGWQNTTEVQGPTRKQRFEARVPGGSISITEETCNKMPAWWMYLWQSGGRFEPRVVGQEPPYRAAIEDALDRCAVLREALLVLLKEAS